MRYGRERLATEAKCLNLLQVLVLTQLRGSEPFTDPTKVITHDAMPCILDLQKLEPTTLGQHSNRRRACVE